MFPLAILLVFLGAAAAPVLLARQSVVVEEPLHGWVELPLDDAPRRGPVPRSWAPPGGALGERCVPGDRMPRFVFQRTEIPAGREIPADTARHHSLRVYRVPTCGESPARFTEHTEPAEPTPAPRPRASATPRGR